MADLINNVLSIKDAEKKINENIENISTENKFLNNLDDFEEQYGNFNITVIGIGGAGCNVIAHMAKAKKWDKNIRLFAVNTDAGALKAIKNLCNVFLIGKNECRGGGSGRNPAIGESAVKSDEQLIKNQILNGSDLVIEIAGLGKGTGSGSTPVISKIAKEMNIPTIAIVNMPSITAEGKEIYNNAINSYKKVVEEVSSICCISNDRIINNSSLEVSLIGAFSNANEEITNIVDNISKMINVTTMINIDYNDVINFFKNTKHFMFTSLKMSNNNYTLENLYKTVDATIKNSYCDINIQNAISIIANISVNEHTSNKIMNDIRDVFVKISNNNNLWVVNGLDNNNANDDINLNILISSDNENVDSLFNSKTDFFEAKSRANILNNDSLNRIQDIVNSSRQNTQQTGLRTSSFLDSISEDEIQTHSTQHLNSDFCINELTKAIGESLPKAKKEEVEPC